MTVPADPAHEIRPFAQQIRRWVIVVIVASFAVAALAGIAVLLTGAQSDPAFKVLSTTALTGVFSIAVLCGAALIGRAWQWFGWVTVSVSVVSLARVLWLVWAEPSWSEDIFKLTITLCVLTAATAVASLLLLLVTHKKTAVRAALFATLVLIATGATLTLLPIWGFEPDPSEPYLQTMGIVWILAALGIVVLPVMSLLLRGPQHPETSVQAATHSIAETSAPMATTVPQQFDQQPRGSAQTLSAAGLERIERAAHTSGITPDELIDRLLPPS